MQQTPRLRRSVLYMPGSNARALEKGRTLAADGLILDLEDAVAPDAKENARQQVIAAVGEGGYGRRELLIRVNGVHSRIGKEDIQATSSSGAHGLLLPKVESAETVHAAAALMQEAGAPEDMAIWCMMETPLGMLHAEEIAFASPRLGGLVMGTSDLAKDLHCHHTADRQPMITSLGLCLLAARAANIAVLDGVYLDLEDEEGLERACWQGVEMGFDGKTLIHPKQLAATNQAFRPSSKEVEWSKRIIGAHAEAEAGGAGVTTVDGKLVEALHVEEAKRIVALAEMAEAMDDSSGEG